MNPTSPISALHPSKFPFDDDAPLTVPDTPEMREYSAIAMIANEEIGLRSDIVEVTYGG